MEHKGIYYHFTHQQGQRTLVLADYPEAYQPISYPFIAYHDPGASAIVDEICISYWQVSSSVTASKVSMNDYYPKPCTTLFDDKNNAVSHKLKFTEVF